MASILASIQQLCLDDKSLQQRDRFHALHKRHPLRPFQVRLQGLSTFRSEFGAGGGRDILESL